MKFYTEPTPADNNDEETSTVEVHSADSARELLKRGAVVNYAKMLNLSREDSKEAVDNYGLMHDCGCGKGYDSDCAQQVPATYTALRLAVESARALDSRLGDELERDFLGELAEALIDLLEPDKNPESLVHMLMYSVSRSNFLEQELKRMYNLHGKP